MWIFGNRRIHLWRWIPYQFLFLRKWRKMWFRHYYHQAWKWIYISCFLWKKHKLNNGNTLVWYTTLPSSKMTEKSQRNSYRSAIIRANFCGILSKISDQNLFLGLFHYSIEFSANWNNAIQITRWKWVNRLFAVWFKYQNRSY